MRGARDASQERRKLEKLRAIQPCAAATATAASVGEDQRDNGDAFVMQALNSLSLSAAGSSGGRNGPQSKTEIVL